MALLSAAALGSVAFGPLGRIERVEVEGARHVTAAEATVASGLAGAPAFTASGTEARLRLLELSAVRDATVEVRLPAAARIRLSEREAVARWVVGAIEWFVDREGVLFSSSDPTAAPALRVLDGRAAIRRAGERLDPELVSAALRLAKVGPRELRADAVAPGVRVEPGANGLVLSSGAGWEIRFGGPERIEEKLALALRFLRDQPARRLEYVDVRDPDRIVYSPQ